MNLSNRVAVLLVLLVVGQAWGATDLNNRDADGQSTAARLTQRFNDTRAQCESPVGPAYQCTGIILRGTVAADTYYSWNPKPANIDNYQGFGGVSFAYLRADSEFSWLPTWIENGFILYPERQTPAGKTALSVLCYFPVDGWTNNRANLGCGQMANIGVSNECSMQNVVTAKQWEDRFKSASTNPRNISFCGFSTVNQSPQQEAPEFAQALQVRGLLKRENPVPQEASQNDEFRIKAWEQNIPEKLPIEAFFFFTDKPDGVKGAQHDQLDYYRQTGEVLPVIELTLQSKDEKSPPHALFAYHPAQQADLSVGGCKRYIQSATWVASPNPVTKKAGWQLQIVPTDCARSMAESETAAAFDELKRKYGGGPQWQAALSKPGSVWSTEVKTDSLRGQFICLWTKYRQKDVWNIEDYREYWDEKNLEEKYDCNPPAVAR